MPIAKKQNPTGLLSPNGATGGVLSRIRPLGERKRGMAVSIYGRPKTGKTRLACSFPKPLLVIGSEDGTDSVIGMKGVDFVLLDRCQELAEIIEGPLASGKYASAVLDNGTRFRDMRISEILGLKKLPVQKGWGFAGREQWMECSQSMKEMLNPLFHLCRRSPLNVIVIAQEQAYNTGEDAGARSELITPTVSCALGKSVCDWVNGECSYILQTMIREETVSETVSVVKGADGVPMTRKTGRKEYCIRISPSEVYEAGFRLPSGRKVEQEFIIDPSFDKIKALINGDE